MEDVFAGPKLSQLLAIAMAVAQTDYTTPFRAHIRRVVRQDAAKQIQILRGAPGGSVIIKAGKLYKARSRLYRSQFLQVNTRWKALTEIYTMHSFAPFFNLKISAKNRQHFFAIEY